MKGVDAALHVAGLGYRVFPYRLKKIGDSTLKIPLIKGWPERATSEPGGVRALWEGRPAAHVGIATGGGLLVVDLDVKNGPNGIAEFGRWAAEHGIDWAATAETPSRGRHVYYRTGVDFKNSASKILPGVDIRSAAGFVATYADVPAFEALPELPEALAGILGGERAGENAGDPSDRAVGPGGVRAAVDYETDRVQFAPDGARNDTLAAAAFSVGQVVGEYLSWEDAYAALWEAAAGMVEDPTEGPAKVADTIERQLNAGMAKPRTVVDETPDEPDAAADGAWRPVDMVALASGEIEPLRPTLLRREDGLCLLYRGRTHSLSGESGSGKSWVAQAATADVLRDGGRVLYLDYESAPASVVERLRALGCAAEDLSRLTYVNPAGGPAGDEFEGLLALPFDLAVVDGVTESLALSGLRGDNLTNSNDAVTRWHAMLPRRIAEETGAAVVQVDHVTKSKDSRGAYAIGGQAKRASITGAAYIVEPVKPFGRGRSGSLRIYVSKDREGFVLGAATGEPVASGTPIALVHVDARPDGGVSMRVVEPPTEDAATGLMVRISEFLAGLSADHKGASTRLIRSEVRAGNDAVGFALGRLADLGYIERRAVGQSILHRHIRPYIADFGEPGALDA